MAGRLDIPKGQEQIKNASQLLIKTAGFQVVKSLLYAPGIIAAEANATPLNKPGSLSMPDVIERDIPILGEKGVSKLGTPVLSNLEIKGITYTKEGVKYTLKTIVLETILMIVSQTKNIITTSIQGKNGTVKEYIADGDYVINIKGILTAPNGVYPLNDVAQLKLALDAQISLEITSWYLQNLGVNFLTITDYTIPQEMGKYSNQSFEINALSDKPVYAFINQ